MLVALVITPGAKSHGTTWSDAKIERGLRCIQKYETPPPFPNWRTRTGNGYYGGLQMDLDFQKSYGRTYFNRWGTANNWPVWAQIKAGIRGAKARKGFNPWPNTRKPCGLPFYF